MSAYSKLRRRRQLFVDAYVRTGIGTEAAIASGYSSKGKGPAVAAAKLLVMPDVKAAVDERKEEAIARAGLRPVRVLEELTYLALASNESLRDENGKLRTFKDLPAEFLRATESIDFNPDGSIKKVRLAKSGAVHMALQYLKLLTNVVALEGKDGGPIQTHEVSDLEKARRIAHLLAQGLRAAEVPNSVLSDPDSVSGDAG
jgi:hypothetical protein